MCSHGFVCVVHKICRVYAGKVCKKMQEVNMKINLLETKKFLDFDRIQQTSYALAEIEKRSSYDDFEISADFC